MRGEPQRHYSVDEYFATEADSSTQHAYFKGEIFAMAGVSLEHNEIAANVLVLSRTALRGSECRAHGGDLRLAKPDVMAICGRAQRAPHRPEPLSTRSSWSRCCQTLPATYPSYAKLAAPHLPDAGA